MVALFIFGLNSVIYTHIYVDNRLYIESIDYTPYQPDYMIFLLSKLLINLQNKVSPNIFGEIAYVREWICYLSLCTYAPFLFLNAHFALMHGDFL